MNTEAAQILDQATLPPAEAPQEASTEVKAEPVKTEAPNRDERISSRLEVLIRREQAAVNRERSAKAKEADIEAKLKRIEEFESSRENPDKALELLGLNYDEITRARLNDGEIPADVKIKKVEEKFDAFRKAQEEAEKKRTEEYQLDQKRQAEAQEAKAISEFRGDLGAYVKDNSSRYEYINFEGKEGIDLVFSVIDTHYQRTLSASAKELAEIGEDTSKAVGKIMTMAEAADKVEAHYEKREFDKRNLKKSQSIWGAIPKEIQNEVAKQVSKPGQPPKTLTNQLSATPSASRKGPLTDEERVQRAVAYARSLRG